MQMKQLDKTGYDLRGAEMIRWPSPGSCFFADTDREATKQFEGQSITESLYLAVYDEDNQRRDLK